MTLHWLHIYLVSYIKAEQQYEKHSRDSFGKIMNIDGCKMFFSLIS